MTTETRKRIRAYKKMLPELRERVIAVALLLAMSASMLGSASFAWITLSRSPEVSGMSTTVAANGNLEIAMAQGSVANPLEPPRESAVGDSSAAEGQNIAGANVTWGNLVNLSDPVYGISEISMRPALLSDTDKNQYPLYGAVYGEDGRVKAIEEKYEYSSWNAEQQFFDAQNVNYGVRAISSIKYSNRTGDEASTTMWNSVSTSYALAQQEYKNIILGNTKVDAKGKISCMDALSGLLQVFVQEKADQMLKDGNIKADYSSHVTYFYRIMQKFKVVMDYEFDALLAMVNLQAYLNGTGKKADGNGNGLATYPTKEAFMADVNSRGLDRIKSEHGIELTSLDTFIPNYQNLVNSLNNTTLRTYAEECDPDTHTTMPYTIGWSSISTYVNYFVDINTAKLEGSLISELNMDSLLGMADKLLFNSKNSPASVTIEDGILKDTEQRIGNYLNQERIVVSIFLTVNYSVINWNNKEVFAYVTTTAARPFDSVTDREVMAKKLATTVVKGTDPEAKDTYGMAIDVWVRTNAPDAVLTLEGQLAETMEPIIVKNKKGEDTELQLMTVVDGDTTDSSNVYQMEGTYYYSDSHQEVEAEILAGATFETQMHTVVIGFEGENRVWEEWKYMLEQGHIQEDSTTQGTGSCFVFYANPTEQTNILKLLDSFSIVFLDEEGEELARASLNTQKYYAINGKVTVPLEISSGTGYVVHDNETGEDIDKKGITRLVQNEPRKITAVIYLDGMLLENRNVLSSGEIQGQLNLQFGSSVPLSSVVDKELQTKYRTITASATYGTTTSTSEKTPISLEYDGNAKNITVNLEVEGEQPEKITGFFVRKINDTQGTQLEAVRFLEDNENPGTWSANFTLTNPGTYLLRSLIVDGIEYTLEHTEIIDDEETLVQTFPTVVISGMNIRGVYLSSSSGEDMTSGVYMTAGNQFEVNVSADIDVKEEALTPGQVRAVFRGTDNEDATITREVNAIMSHDGGVWEGTATIRNSGTYTLTYLVIDGEYYPVATEYQVTLIVNLGLTSQVWINPSEITDENDVPMQLTSTTFEFTKKAKIPLQVRIYNNSGLEQRNLGDGGQVDLYYLMSGSSMVSNGLHTRLRWNPDTEYYDGMFPLIKAGNFSFYEIRITDEDGNVSRINNTISAESITAIPPEPPAYNSGITRAYNDDKDYQIAIDDGSAALSAYVAYAESATVQGRMVSLDPQNPMERLVSGSLKADDKRTIDGVDYYRYEFKIPSTSAYTGNLNDTSQDGKWQLTEILFQGVFVDLTPDDGDPTTTYIEAGSEDFYILDVPAEDGVDAYVVGSLYTSLTKEGETGEYTGDVFGGTVDSLGRITSYEGSFMESHTVNPVTLTVADWKGAPITGLTDATWAITYQGNSQSYGGYTGQYPGMSADGLTQTFDGTSVTFPTQTFSFAGTYNTGVSANLNGKTIELYRPKITVISKTPTVKISAVDPKGEHSARLDGSMVTLENKIISLTEAKVSSGCEYKSFWGLFGNKNFYIYSPVSVEITLENAGWAESASLPFKDTTGNAVTKLYTTWGASRDYQNWTENPGNYEWNNTNAVVNGCNGAVSLYVGQTGQGYALTANTSSNGMSSPVGVINAENLYLTYGGKTYTVIANIVIDNEA